MIRPYSPHDAAATLSVFLAAVTVTAAADYTAEQITAWARDDQRELTQWNEAMSARNSFVAVIDTEVVGFSDVAEGGYIDMMFVSPAHQRSGVARKLLEHAESSARHVGAVQLTANVSITARPFFESCGFAVEAEQHPIINGVQLTNFAMSKPLS